MLPGAQHHLRNRRFLVSFFLISCRALGKRSAGPALPPGRHVSLFLHPRPTLSNWPTKSTPRRPVPDHAHALSLLTSRGKSSVSPALCLSQNYCRMIGPKKARANGSPEVGLLVSRHVRRDGGRMASSGADSGRTYPSHRPAPPPPSDNQSVCYFTPWP